jgi:hypothetical protein
MMRFARQNARICISEVYTPGRKREREREREKY